MPDRIQLHRTKGWRKPPGVIVVARPTTWGNPFTIRDARDAGYTGTDEELRALCVHEFRAWIRNDLDHRHVRVEQRQWILDHVHELAGHDLGCWCPPDEPCHADVLLELANQEVSR